MREDDGAKLQFSPGDEAGEAKTADGRLVPERIVARAALEAFAGRADEFKTRDVAADGPGDMMIFAMNVIGDGAPESHVLGAGGDRQKPATGDGEVEDFSKCGAGFAAQQGRSRD